jgi:phosphoenolpyruvate carboxylase
VKLLLEVTQRAALLENQPVLAQSIRLRNPHVADIQEFANIQVEVIAQPAVAEQLLARLEKDCFPRNAMIACESDVRVLRREKF